MAEEDEKAGCLFPTLDGGESQVTELDSLCMYCYKEGRTRMLLTRIPHFRELIISSFSCDHCGFEDRSTQSGGRIQDKGVRYVLKVKDDMDLNRQVVKSEWAVLSVPEVQFEQPVTKRGEVNTVEGILALICSGLGTLQAQRREQDPDTATKIDDFIEKLTSLRNLKEPFTLLIDDPSGNSYVENPFVPESDLGMTITHYTRTRDQDVLLGLVEEEVEDEVEEAQAEEEQAEDLSDVKEEEVPAEDKGEENLKNQVLTFESNCPECNSPCDTNMKVIDIPFFKECIIMALVCDSCGYRENEVKSGSGIEPKGRRITLKITDPSDLSRDLLKSDTCQVAIPELEFELMSGTLGGRFTTVEGLLVTIRDQLSKKNPFIMGDTGDDLTAARMVIFTDKLQKIIDGNMLGVHLVLSDPGGGSYLQNLYAPEDDPEMKVEEYERSHEDNEMLGLNDMKTENYDVTS